MTRAAMLTLAGQLLQQTLSAATEGDPFAENALLNIVTDDFASLGDLFYTQGAPIDIAANTFRYASPGLHHVTSAELLTSTNGFRILRTIDPAKMDRLRGGGWRNTPFADTSDVVAAPEAFLVQEGTNSLRLWPPPSFTRAAALLTEGFGAPGGSWSGQTAECPLPVWTHRAIVYAFAVERCVQVEAVSDRKLKRLQDAADMRRLEVERKVSNFIQGAGVRKSTNTSGERTGTPGMMPASGVGNDSAGQSQGA